MHTVKLLAAFGALTVAAGVVSADAVTEYTSLANWEPAVSNVATHMITGGYKVVGTSSVTFGPGTFTAGSVWGTIFNDNQYEPGEQYFSDDPGQIAPSTAAVTVSFKASADVTALAFTIGTFYEGDSVSILLNGLSIAPVKLSSGRPGSVFLGVTDTSGPITSIKFSEGPSGEMDVIGSYATASAVAAPEMDPTSSAIGLTLLLGALAVLRGRGGQSLTTAIRIPD
jgi:hypothetical protein